MTLEANIPLEIYLESVDFPLLLLKQVFTNEDGSTGIQYLVSSNTRLNPDQMTTIYRKRWNVEPYHKSLKQNASLENRLPRPSPPKLIIYSHPFEPTSNLNGCGKPPNLITLPSNPNSISPHCIRLLLPFVISSLFSLLRKVSY